MLPDPMGLSKWRCAAKRLNTRGRGERNASRPFALSESAERRDMRDDGRFRRQVLRPAGPDLALRLWRHSLAMKNTTIRRAVKPIVYNFAGNLLPISQPS